MTQNPTTFALKGAVCFSTDSRHLTCLEDAYLVCQDGRSVGVFPKLPEHFSRIPVRNVSPCLIIPGMNDHHLHAPQYAFHGKYMDLELLQEFEKEYNCTVVYETFESNEMMYT